MLAQPLAAACSSRRPGGQSAVACLSMSRRKPRYAVAELVIRFRFRFSMKSDQTCGSAHSGLGKSSALRARGLFSRGWAGVGLVWGSGGKEGEGEGRGLSRSVTLNPVMSRDVTLSRWRFAAWRSRSLARRSVIASCAACERASSSATSATRSAGVPAAIRRARRSLTVRAPPQSRRRPSPVRRTARQAGRNAGHRRPRRLRCRPDRP